MSPLEVLAEFGYRTHRDGGCITLIPAEMPMTINELETAVWEARATLALDANGTPTVAEGEFSPAMRAALVEHREEVVCRLKGLRGAKLQGLVCSWCVPSVLVATAEQWRMCPTHGNVLHYRRPA